MESANKQRCLDMLKQVGNGSNELREWSVADEQHLEPANADRDRHIHIHAYVK